MPVALVDDEPQGAQVDGRQFDLGRDDSRGRLVDDEVPAFGRGLAW
jgi:hypothetical protein